MSRAEVLNRAVTALIVVATVSVFAMHAAEAHPSHTTPVAVHDATPPLSPHVAHHAGSDTASDQPSAQGDHARPTTPPSVSAHVTQCAAVLLGSESLATRVATVGRVSLPGATPPSQAAWAPEPPVPRRFVLL